jgi:hypothetical protein
MIGSSVRTKMKKLPLVLILALCGCAGIERINTKHKSDSQLKLRLSQTERELYGPRDQDADKLQAERDAIERELLQRYERGDEDARLPTFP